MDYRFSNHSNFKKISIFLLGILFIFTSFIIYHKYIKNEIKTNDLKKIQSTYSKKELLLSELNTQLFKDLKSSKKENYFRVLSELSVKYKKKGFSFFVYVNDSLQSWSNNKVPLPIKLDKTFTGDKIMLLKNGWFRTSSLKKDSTTLVGVFLIKNEFPYENKDLVNHFHPDFKFPYEAKIETTTLPNYSIQGVNEQSSFSVVPNKKTPPGYSFELFSILLLIAGFSIIIFSVFQYSKSNFLYLFTALITIIIRGFFITYQEESWFKDMEIFQPDIYASSEWFPSFGDLIINAFTFFVFAFLLLRLLRKILKNSKLQLIIKACILFLGIIVWVLYTNFTIESLVVNSNINFDLNQFFHLNWLSFVGLVIIGVHFLLFFLIMIDGVYCIKKLKINAALFFVTIFLLGVVFILTSQNTTDLGKSTWPFLLILVLGFFKWKSSKQLSFTQTLLVLLSVSFVISTLISNLNFKKEIKNRLAYTERLVTDEDPLTEIEYDRISKKIQNSSLLRQVIFDSLMISKSELDAKIENLYFSKFWEKYEINFEYFNSDQLLVNNRFSTSTLEFDDINSIVTNKSTASGINPGIYFVPDYSKKINYIIFESLYYEDSLIGYFTAGLKSKKIPEQIGFPKLLLDKNTKTIEELSNYSLSRYSDGDLITQFGSFVYPLEHDVWMEKLTKDYNYFDYNHYNHLIYKINNQSIVVVSKKSNTSYAALTSFSYLFTFFGLLYLMLILFKEIPKGLSFSNLSLNAKIQLLSITLVIVTLIAFVVGSGIYLREQYLNKNVKQFKEKVGSVELEMLQKLGKEDELNTYLQNYSEGILKKFSNVFNTDINLYDTNGFLFASSRPKIFSVGLLSEFMNSEAQKEIIRNKNSEFIHSESIGKLSYLSAYVPLFNNKNILLGYINLQYFSKQNELEDDMASLMVAIINIFVLLFAISVIGTVFVSNWMTQPIKFIRQSLKRIELGKKNQIIEYDGKDEIGDLVKEYNLKVAELEKNAEQLAKSERESAWREMAKQVAHEIKNPLTPMKLSIQHLQRSFDKNDPDAEEKISKLTHSLIEQIDGLTHIANAFSNFAKLPQPQNESIDLIDILKNCIHVYDKKNGIKILFDSEVEKAVVLIDKNLITRVFNNLIINASQAIPDEIEGEIDIRLKQNENTYLISIKDNGTGVQEELKDKIFSPNFTTKSTGTGLGLAMVKNIIETYKGNVWFESSKGKGSTFSIELPNN